MRCQVGPVPDFVFWFFVCFWLTFLWKWSVLLKTNELCILQLLWLLYSFYIGKESLCFLHWSLHSFLCLKPLAPFCRYYSLELENIHFIFMSRFWFVFYLECVSDPCCFESFFAWVILVSFCMLIFSVLGRKDWFFISLSVTKRSFSFLSLFLYSQVFRTIFFLFCARLFEILDITFIKKKYLFSTLCALELDLFGNVSEIIFPLSFYASFSSMKR